MTDAQVHARKQFGMRLGQERRRKGVEEHRDVYKRDVAKALGVAESTVGRWETGGGSWPRPAEFSALAAYFGVTEAWLRYGVEPREAPPALKRAVVDTEPGHKVTGRAKPSGKRAG